VLGTRIMEAEPFHLDPTLRRSIRMKYDWPKKDTKWWSPDITHPAERNED
jgi:hypothetical protein